MNVSIQLLTNHLSHYLKLARTGETVIVTSHDKPIAKIEWVSETAEVIPEIPLVQWAREKPRLTRSVAEPPKIEGESLADWIVCNR